MFQRQAVAKKAARLGLRCSKIDKRLKGESRHIGRGLHFVHRIRFLFVFGFPRFSSSFGEYF